MKSWRNVLLWLHLSIGLVTGLVIFYLSLTGMLIAFKPQIMDWSRFGGIDVSATPLPLPDLLNRVSPLPENFKSLTLWREKPGVIEIQTGRDKKLVSSATAELLENHSYGWNSFFETTTNLHRWFRTTNEGDHQLQKMIKGIIVILFLTMVVSGVVLWWPTQVFKLNRKLKNKAKQWNRHNVFGIWFAPFIILISVTGLIMAHQWANNLLFLATNSPLQAPKKAEEKPEVAVPNEKLAALVKLASERIPEWETLNVKVAKGAVNISIEEVVWGGLRGRSQLVFDAQSGQELIWEPFNDQSAGRKARSFIKPLHTGEAGGFLGQILVVLASLASMLLVWTGFAMSYRRFIKRTA